MAGGFDGFVMFAGMRTGSNFLEESLNAIPGVQCHGEVFNPHFVGHADRTELFGITLEERARDPAAMLVRLRERTGGLAGFRFFHDHDPRVLEAVLPDPGIAKIVLSRNPVETYVSRRIAAATGQWRLGDLKRAKSARIRFEPAGFDAHLAETLAFHALIRRGLQTTGQTAFWIDYEDLGDPEVLGGLARFLGVAAEGVEPSRRTKKQNPEPLEERVENYAEMVSALARADVFALGQAPSFEPGRGAGMPRHVAAARAAVLFLPVDSGPWTEVEDWLAALDGVGAEALARGFTQRTLRQWMRRHPGHRSFTVLRHPAERLHAAFRARAAQPESDLTRAIAGTYRVAFPAGGAAADPDAERESFLAFLAFVAGNLGGQTGLPVHASWASQAALLQGIAGFRPPDAVLRADRLAEGLAFVAAEAGTAAPPAPRLAAPAGLAAIHDDAVEAACRQAHQRDYVLFGFGPWTGAAED